MKKDYSQVISKIDAIATKIYDDFHTETIGGKELVFCCGHCAKAYKNSINH